MFEKHELLRDVHQIGQNTRERLVHSRWCPQLAEFGIKFCGISDAAEGFHFVWRTHEFSSILVTFSGEGQALVSGELKPCRQGAVYLISPGVTAAYEAVPTSRWGVAWITYEATKRHVPPFAADQPLLFQTDPAPLRAAIEGLYAEAAGTADANAIRSWAELAHWYALRATMVYQDRHGLWQVWREVEADLSRPWSIDNLAEIASVSREHLRRLCKRQLGRSPIDHVIHLRMRRAANLLICSDSKLSVISSAVGYANSFAFSVAFSRIMGQSPTAYRAEHRSTMA